MRRPFLSLLSLAAGTGALMAGPITVPNGSFESPVTLFVNTHVDCWQKVPKPDWYIESGGYTWDQLAGTFKNTPITSADRIVNCDGNQAIWVFAIPEMGLFQDYDSIDWSNSVPTHAFNATFEPGKAYKLSVGVIGGGGNMAPGASLELALYYRDAASNQVPVAVTSITNAPELFTNTTTVVDFHVNVPTVKSDDPWSGQKIGIRMLSTVTTNLQGGYWDLDNVRLADSSPPSWTTPTWSNGVVTLTLQSEPGLRFEIVTSTDPLLPVGDWANAGILTNTTGKVSFTDTVTNFSKRFYQARQLP